MLSSDFLLKGVAAPALAAFVATLVLFRLFAGRRASGAVAFAVALTLGTVLTHSSGASWFPSRNLHWVPWVAVLSAIVSPIVVAGGLAGIERWLLAALATLGAAALLVPDWPELSPSRPVSITGFVLAMTVIARGLDGVARRLPPRLVVIAMWGTSLAAAGAIAIAFSLKIGESELMTSASLFGVTAAILIRPDEMAVRGLALTFALAVGGWCYVVAVEPAPPTPPIWALLPISAAPLVLWMTAIGPLARKGAAVRWVVSTVLVVGVLGALVAWAHFSTEDGGESSDYGGPETASNRLNFLFPEISVATSHEVASRS